MNNYIERIEVIKFSLWDGLQINFIQAILLVLFVAGISRWLMDKSTAGLKLGLLSFLAFIGLRSYSYIISNQQQKVVVYNVPQKTAIDFINGREYKFVGDLTLLADDFARNFHLKPARILFRVKETETLRNLRTTDNYIDFNGKRILLLDSTMAFDIQETKPTIDLLVISKNPKIYMKILAGSLDIKQVVFDGSVPAWKATYWKRDCDSLNIPWHDVTIKGAFVMKVK